MLRHPDFGRLARHTGPLGDSLHYKIGVGLFGVTGGGAHIRDLNLLEVDVTGREQVGGLVGSQQGSRTIRNGVNTGAVTGGNSTGGLIGDAETATIIDSYNLGPVNGTSTVGGLVGSLYGTIENSYNAATSSRVTAWPVAWQVSPETS